VSFKYQWLKIKFEFMKTSIFWAVAMAAMATINANAQTTADFGVKDSKYVYEQDFNALPKTNNETGTSYFTYKNAGTATDVTLSGWYVSTANATPTYGTGLKCDNGSYFTGTSLFSYGSMTAKLGGTPGENRALGAIAGKNGWSYFGVLLKNNTGSTVNSLTVKFAGETWRKGCEVNKASGGLACDMVVNPTFSDQTNFYVAPAFIAAGTTVDGLSYASALTGAADATAQSATGLEVDGHADANRTVKTYTFTTLNWAAGQTLFIRWSLSNVPYDAANSVYAQWGLAVDDFSATINDVFPTGIQKETVNSFRVAKNGSSWTVTGDAGEVVEIYTALGAHIKNITLANGPETISGLKPDALYLLKGKTEIIKIVY
jgi:hypothetical protein